jgi:hypothetical protein
MIIRSKSGVHGYSDGLVEDERTLCVAMGDRIHWQR